MLPHPVLATEDDKNYVMRTLLEFPDLINDFFECLESLYIEARGDEFNHRANVLYLTIYRKLKVLSDIPKSAYRTFSDDGVECLDEELPKLLERLSRLFLQEVVTISPQALAWKKPCQGLAGDCASHMRQAHLRFPHYMKFRREMVDYDSYIYFCTNILFGVAVVLAVAVMVVVGAVNPPRAVGLTVTIITAVILIIFSAIYMRFSILSAQSLHTLYSRFFNECVINGNPREVELLMRVRATDQNKDGAGPLGNSGDAPLAKAVAGGETKQGFYSIEYGSDMGYIDGRQLDAQVVMIAYDENFIITRWNSAAEVITGFLEGGCVGKPLSEVVQSPSSGDDICEQLKRAKKGNLIKIKLRSLVAAPATLFTTVSPIISHSGKEVGSILICANAKDNLREYRTYIHNYQISEASAALTVLSERGTLTAEDSNSVRNIRQFMHSCWANLVEEHAREMVAEWEWSNVEQLLGRAIGSNNSNSHDINVDPMCPPTLCSSPLVPKTIGMVVSQAGGRCAISVQTLNVRGNVYTLAVTISPGAKCRRWNRSQLEQMLQPMLRGTAGNAYFVDKMVILHFPCQVAAFVEDSEETTNPGSEQAQQLTQARTIINCTVNVVTAVSNMVDQHNLSLILLKTMFVSLASVQEVSDLEQRLAARPCEVDVVICDTEWLRTCRDILSGDHGAVVIPLLDTDTPVPGNYEYVIRLPIAGRDAQNVIVEVGKTVSMKKNAISALQERERILTLRQDSPWTKGKLLGRGSYGAVYEATSDLTGGIMAVKMFYFGADREDSINQLLNEIQIMCSLNHPNIVHYFHCERQENNVSLFMELCQGSLTDIIVGRRKKPAHLTVIQIIRQVLSAIAYLHGRGITHRDIKPQNILLKGDSIKLTDFGTARQGAATKEVTGTFRYMAPEVYKGEKHSLPCDIWSVGCLVCELFACPPRFMDQNSLLGDMASTTEFLQEIPDNPLVNDFIRKCFLMEPEKRPTAQDLLVHPMLSATSAISNDVDKLPTVFDATKEIAADVSRQSAFSITSV